MTPLESVLAIMLVIAVLAAWRTASRRRRESDRIVLGLNGQLKQCEAELRAQGEHTAALLDRMVEGIIVTDRQGRIRIANRAAGSLFGFLPPAANRSVLEATHSHEIAALVSSLEAEPEVLDHELRLENVTAIRFIRVNLLALRTADGRHDGAIAVFHDVTRVRELEALRQEFVANVSHELRTPLSLIRSSVETLIDAWQDDPAVTSRFLAIIDRHAKRLTVLIDDLLLLSHLDSGRVQMSFRPVRLRNAAQDALNDAEMLAHARGVTFDNQIPEGIAAHADPDRLRQVLANLIDNAIKYGRSNGHVVLRGRTIDSARVEFSVHDDGPGIPDEAKDRIFERFYRVDKARSREQGGTGLGLAIVKNVVLAHGGQVRMESAPGCGAEFFVTLPSGRL